MKYVIKYNFADHNCEGLPERPAYMVNFRLHRGRHHSPPSIEGTDNVANAMLYQSWDAASVIVGLLIKRHASARIHGVSDKDLFKARLKG